MVEAVIKYQFKGTVESVGYADNSTWPCYISINVVDNEIVKDLYHATKSDAMCRFAERCQILGTTVKAYASAADVGNSIIYFLEQANTNAKWFNNPVNWY